MGMLQMFEAVQVLVKDGVCGMAEAMHLSRARFVDSLWTVSLNKAPSVDQGMRPRFA